MKNCGPVIGGTLENKPDSPTAEPPASTSGKGLPHWLLEGIFIVVSVMLGFGVAQLGDYRSERERATRALSSVLRELETNLSIVEPLLPVHQAWADVLEKADTTRITQSAAEFYWTSRPQLPPNAKTYFPFLRRSAWDAALLADALRLIDQDVAEALSEVYRVQEITTENVQRLTSGPFSSAATFDPASRAASVRLLWVTLADIVSAEIVLRDLYRQHLPSIHAAAGTMR